MSRRILISFNGPATGGTHRSLDSIYVIRGGKKFLFPVEYFFLFFLSFDYHSGTREEWRKEVRKEGKRDIFFGRILMKGGDELIRMLMD